MSDLLDRLAAALAAPPPPDLLAGDMIEGAEGDAIPAAVLVAITDRPSPGLILTVRREHLRAHAGQVAFPGGRLDAGEDAATAALREAHEELALDPITARLIGQADPYRTVTNYIVTPIAAIVPPDLPLVANPDEVADWFEVPLDFALDPKNQKRMSAEFRGRRRHYYGIAWNDRQIWGATAAMLVNLTRRLQAVAVA